MQKRTSNISINWYEASAESMPLADETFDVVLCQMGLQFVPNKLAALREMRRVLNTDGRVYVTVPGPRPAIFGILGDALVRHLSLEAKSFIDLVFSMHNVHELAELMRSAGFREVDVQAKPKKLRLPAPKDFLWQYIYSTPLANAAAQTDTGKLDALERDVCMQWQEFASEGSLSVQVSMTTGSAVK